MSDQAPFEGWAVIELMGHRKLGGRLSEQLVAGAPFIRVDVPGPCAGSGVSARWCPAHGDCKCPKVDGDGHELTMPSLNDPGCPLHAPDSKHPEEWTASQFYAPNAVYCITPCTEETARGLARRASWTPPVQRYELLPEPKPNRPTAAPPDLEAQSLCPHGRGDEETCAECDEDDEEF